jgi:hypothetical protein
LTKSSKFLEYMKLHLISLEQDLEELSIHMEKLDPAEKEFEDCDFEYNNISGQTIATRHLLSVATDIMNSSNERYE